jgi:hypothetical protein
MIPVMKPRRWIVKVTAFPRDGNTPTVAAEASAGGRSTLRQIALAHVERGHARDFLHLAHEDAVVVVG